MTSALAAVENRWIEALEPGQSVLVLGATGNAGGMAVQVAKHLGAGRVVAAGRNAQRLEALPALGADAVVALDDDADLTAERLAAAAAEVDIVLDYLWGEPAAAAVMALLRARADRSRAMDWIQIGAMAGPTLELPSVALRSANLRIQGNGQGAVSTRAYLAELPSLIAEIDAGVLQVEARPIPWPMSKPSGACPTPRASASFSFPSLDLGWKEWSPSSSPGSGTRGQWPSAEDSPGAGP